MFSFLYFSFMIFLSLFMFLVFFGGVIYYRVFEIKRLPIDKETDINQINFKNHINPFKWKCFFCNVHQKKVWAFDEFCENYHSIPNYFQNNFSDDLPQNPYI